MGNHMCKAHDFAPTLRNKEASNCEPCWFKKTHTDSTPWVGLSVVELLGWEAIPAQAMTCKRSYPTNPSSTLFLCKSLRVGANNCIVWSSLDMGNSVTPIKTTNQSAKCHQFRNMAAKLSCTWFYRRVFDLGRLGFWDVEKPLMLTALKRSNLMVAASSHAGMHPVLLAQENRFGSLRNTSRYL